MARRKNIVQNRSRSIEGEWSSVISRVEKLVTAMSAEPDVLGNKAGTAELFGIPVQIATKAQALETVQLAVSKRRALRIGVINAAKVVNMHRDPNLKASVLDSDVIYADGMSLVWASIILGRRLPERVTGIDLMFGILRQGRDYKYRIYCLGATQHVVERVREEFSTGYPGVEIVGVRNGYFSDEDEEAIARNIRDSAADILFVAITSPKKEQFMARWADYMNIPVVHGVGGSFDIVAGIATRAPKKWRSLGLEWLYRVKQEPRRLWRRYLVTNTAFMWMLLKELVKSRVVSSKGRQNERQGPSS